MNKIILSVVAIATLYLSSHADTISTENYPYLKGKGYTSCNIPDMTQYLPETAQKIKDIQESDTKEGSYMKTASLLGTLEGFERGFTTLHGALTTNTLKQIGVGANISTGYKQIALNYSKLLASLNNEELFTLFTFLRVTHFSNAYDEIYESQTLPMPMEIYEKIIFNSYYYEIENISNDRYIHSLSEGTFIGNYILGDKQQEATLEDPQLKAFIKAIVKDDLVKARKIMLEATIYHPSVVKDYKKYKKTKRPIEFILLNATDSGNETAFCTK